MDVPKCSFCLDINSKRGLIDLNSKLYGLDVIGVPISKVASEVFNFKIIDGFICGNCQEELVNAFKFKVNAMKAFEGNSELTKNLEILKSLKDIFDDIESINDVTIMNNHKNIAIIRKNECHKFIPQGWRNESCEDTTIEILEIECNPEQIQEAIETNEEEEEEIHHETSIVGNEEEEETQHEMEDENENLNPEFKDETTYLKCEKETMQNTMNVVTNYTSCNIDYMKSAYVRLERLKSLDSPEKDSTFQDDLSDTMDVEYDSTICENEPLDNNENEDSLVSDKNDSNLNETKSDENLNSIINQKVRESKVVTHTGGGDVSVWSCIFCKKLYFYGHTLKSHLLVIHYSKKEEKYKKRKRNVDQEKKYEYNREWIEKIIQKSTPEDGSGNMTCCLCKKFTTTKDSGMRLHIAKMHCLKKPERRSIDRVSQHEYDIEWIREKMEESKVETEDDKWNCVVCNEFSATTIMGIRSHISQAHCKPKKKKVQNVSRFNDKDRHEYDPDWINKMIEKSRTSDDSNLFSCTICKNFSSKSFTGIRCHIIFLHCKARKKMNPKFGTINKNINIEIEKHEYDLDWIQEMMEKSKIDDNMKTFLCNVCENFKTSSTLGIRQHIVREHCNRNAQEAAILARRNRERHEYDPEWINQKMEESKKGEDGQWTCSVCNEFSAKSRVGMQQHITRLHCEKISLKSEDEIEDDDEEDERHEYDVEWIKEIVEKAKIRNENKYCCVVCENFTTHSEVGIRYHVARTHCKPRNKNPFDRSISENNADSEWLKGMIEKSKTPSSSTLWNCCVCDNFSCFSLSAIRKHLITLHCESTSSGSLNHQDDKLQANESISERIRKNWIKNVVNNSEVKKEDGIFWICCICSTTCEGFKETKLHVSRMHRKEMRTETHKLIKEEEDAFQNDKVEKCRKRLHTSEEVKNVWICRECGGKICYTEEDFRKHLRVEHMNKFDGTEESTIRNGNKRSLDQSDDDDEWVPLWQQPPLKLHCASDTEIEDVPIKCETILEESNESKQEDQIEYLHLLPPDMLLSESSESSNDEMESKSIDDQNKTEVDQIEAQHEYVMKSNMTRREKIWMKKGMKASKVSNSHYKCWICSYTCKDRGSSRHHVIRNHLPFFKLSTEKYKAHKLECKNLKDNSNGFRLPKIKSNFVRNIKKREPKQERVKLGKKLWQCNICDLKFLKKYSYRMHNKVHHICDNTVIKMKLEKCDLCDMQFRNLDDLNYHKNIHKTKGESESIPAEGFCFRSKLKVDSVEVLPHHDEDNWNEICGHCTQKYRSEEDLKRHIMFFHMKPLLCPIDNETFKKFDDFLLHVHSSHLMVRNETPVVDNGCLEETSNDTVSNNFPTIKEEREVSFFERSADY
ncbi:CLUMA_CG015385, isoform A [Clunio marinus]|uniref:CLUMA_CG015385, isoform A n=1 Tax=Clunio marinus TaxID=568069 RepID=A0A1J1ISX5_9DIPT|nr:CLUMA_CG015385, isoform A [Clunio marinus]